MVAGGRTIAPIELKIGQRSHPGLFSNRLNLPWLIFSYEQFPFAERPKKVDHGGFRRNTSPGTSPEPPGLPLAAERRLPARENTRGPPGESHDRSSRRWEAD